MRSCLFQTRWPNFFSVKHFSKTNNSRVGWSRKK